MRHDTKPLFNDNDPIAIHACINKSVIPPIGVVVEQETHDQRIDNYIYQDDDEMENDEIANPAWLG